MAFPESESAAVFDAAERRPRIFFGWWIVAACSLIQMLQNCLLQQAYGAYIVSLQREFGWTKTVLSLGSSEQQGVYGLTGPAVGVLLDHVGPRTVVRAGFAIMAAGFVLLARIHSLGGFFFALLVISIGANLAGYLATTFVVVQWFERRRSSALSLAGVGTSLGGIAFVLLAFLFTAVGWRSTALITAAILLVVGIPLGQLLHRRPSDIGLEVDGGEDRRPGSASRPRRLAAADFTLGEAMNHPTFWWVSFGHASAVFVVSAVNVHLVPYLTQTQHYSLGHASGIVALMTLMFGIGTVSGGFVGDRGNRQTLSMACMAMHMSGMLILAYAQNDPMVLAFAVVHGYAWGWRGPQMAALRADYFGRAAFGKIMGVSNVIVTIGTMCGPLIAGFAYDHTGSYRVGFDILAGIAAVGSIFFYLAKRPAPPNRAPAATASPSP